MKLKSGFNYINKRIGGVNFSLHIQECRNNTFQGEVTFDNDNNKLCFESLLELLIKLQNHVEVSEPEHETTALRSWNISKKQKKYYLK